MLNIYYLLLWY